MKTLYRNKYRSETARKIDWDYAAPGYYFVTICTKDRVHWFGKIKNSELFLNVFGEFAKKCWLEIPAHFPWVEIINFVVMPNHVHGVLFLKNYDERGWQPNKFGPQTMNLASIIRGYKIGVTKQARQINTEFAWQSRYHDRIIRNDKELEKISKYIDNNVYNWNQDNLNVNNPKLL